MDGWKINKPVFKVNILTVLDFLQTQFAPKFTEIQSFIFNPIGFVTMSLGEKI